LAQKNTRGFPEDDSLKVARKRKPKRILAENIQARREKTTNFAGPRLC